MVAAMRYGTAILVGAAITAGLLVMMQVLIATGKAAITEERAYQMVDFVRVKRQETVAREERKPEKPPEPEAPPPQAPTPQLDDINPSMDAISVAPAAVSAEVSAGGGLGLAKSDGDYLPIVKVAPIYPRRALSRGLEGYVIVEFTVTKLGTVRDVVVVESTSSVFERAAIDAALKFKYKPRVVDGEPIEVAGVRNKITFELEG